MTPDEACEQPRIYPCHCGFATDDPEWFAAHQHQHEVGRLDDARAYTVDELQQIRRDLAASLERLSPNSPARISIVAQMSAVDARLARLAADTPTALPPYRLAGLPCVLPIMPLRPERARGTGGRWAAFKGA
jgi:hypothetical protein